MISSSSDEIVAGAKEIFQSVHVIPASYHNKQYMVIINETYWLKGGYNKSIYYMTADLKRS